TRDGTGVRLGGRCGGARGRGGMLGAGLPAHASDRAVARGEPGGAMSLAVAGALLGLVGGVGLLLLIAGLRGRRTTLDERLAPARRPRDASSGLLCAHSVHSPFVVVEKLLAPWV